MVREIIKYIFIETDKITKYEQSIRVNEFYSTRDGYKHFDKISIYGLNLFLRDKEIMGDFKIDFIVLFRGVHYYMYAERITIDNNNYIFKLESIINIIKNNKFSYEDVLFTNTYRRNEFEIEDGVKQFKIIDDGVNNFDSTHNNILDNLPFSIENIYLLYDIKTPITNLPFTIKKVFVYNDCDINLIKLPYDCEIIRI